MLTVLFCTPSRVNLEEFYGKAGSSARLNVGKSGAASEICLDGVSLAVPPQQLAYAQLIGCKAIQAAVDAVQQVSLRR